MLARTADNLYWLSRYIERAEYLARILEATHRVATLPVGYAGSTNEWQSALSTAGCAAAFFAASELVRLQWQDIDRERGLIHCRRAKNRTNTDHPLTGPEMRGLRKLEAEQKPPVATSS